MALLIDAPLLSHSRLGSLRWSASLSPQKPNPHLERYQYPACTVPHIIPYPGYMILVRGPENCPRRGLCLNVVSRALSPNSKDAKAGHPSVVQFGKPAAKEAKGDVLHSCHLPGLRKGRPLVPAFSVPTACANHSHRKCCIASRTFTGALSGRTRLRPPPRKLHMGNPMRLSDHGQQYVKKNSARNSRLMALLYCR